MELLKRDLKKLYHFKPIYETGSDGEKYVAKTEPAGIIYGNPQPERLTEISEEGGVLVERLLKVYAASRSVKELDYLIFNGATYKVLTVEDWQSFRKLTLKLIDGGDGGRF
jgi:hypothetical protein